jgi:transposase-like protein
MTGKRRRFTAEFKEESVRLVLNSGRPLAQVARELGIHENTLHKWKASMGDVSRRRIGGCGRC